MARYESADNSSRSPRKHRRLHDRSRDSRSDGSAQSGDDDSRYRRSRSLHGRRKSTMKGPRHQQEDRMSYRQKQQSNFLMRNNSVGRRRQDRSRDKHFSGSSTGGNRRNKQSRENRHEYRFDSPPKQADLDRENIFLKDPVKTFEEMVNEHTQRDKVSRELYVSNLPYGVSAEMITDYINALIVDRRLNIMPGGPVLRTSITMDAQHVFCEFRTVEEATKGLELNGHVWNGSALKVGRPRLAEGMPALTYGEVGRSVNDNCVAASGDVEDVPVLPIMNERLCISNVPKSMTEQQIREFLSSFGPLRFLYLVQNKDEKNHRGVVIGEYEDAQLSQMAERTLDGMQLDYRTIRVDRYQAAMRDPVLASLFHSVDLGTLMQPEAQSKVLMLKHLVSPAELEADEEFRDIVEDVKVECAKHGIVMSLHIPRPKKQQLALKNEESENLLQLNGSYSENATNNEENTIIKTEENDGQVHSTHEDNNKIAQVKIDEDEREVKDKDISPRRSDDVNEIKIKREEKHRRSYSSDEKKHVQPKNKEDEKRSRRRDVDDCRRPDHEEERRRPRSKYTNSERQSRHDDDDRESLRDQDDRRVQHRSDEDNRRAHPKHDDDDKRSNDSPKDGGQCDQAEAVKSSEKHKHRRRSSHTEKKKKKKKKMRGGTGMNREIGEVTTNKKRRREKNQVIDGTRVEIVADGPDLVK
eukprot:GHVL01027997.1.p1 GENE.GHVL01027997.1~~GHVL01027997.1.p1  ORF type:complete len:709 (+),score=117.98 GHVL01027997.1:40-2127(+)